MCKNPVFSWRGKISFLQHEDAPGTIIKDKNQKGVEKEKQGEEGEESELQIKF